MDTGGTEEIKEQHQKVSVGDRVEINCEVTGSPRPVVQWVKLNGRLPANAQVQDTLLIIPSVAANDAGTYRCVASNVAGTSYAKVVLEVEGPPDFLSRTQSRTASLGSKVVLTCQASGSPQPDITWRKRGGRLPRGHTVGNGKLTIQSLAPEDIGEYICTARNRYGVAEAIVRLSLGTLVPYFQQDPASHISYPTLNDAYLEFDIELSFIPEANDGLILYNGQMDNGAGDFVAFGMRQGAAEFRFDVGSGPAIIRSRDVALNKWNTVRLKRDRKQGSLYIKGREFRGTAPGKFEGLDLIDKMYVGGVPDYGAISKQAGFSSGFVGGISRFEIRGQELDLGGAAIEKVGVGDYPVCQGNPCMNGGVCQAAYTLHGYKCTCPKGYSGQRCQLRGERCFPGACGDKGRCYDLSDNRGYRCACPVGRTGARCEKGIVVQKLSFNRTSFAAYPVIQDALLKLQINLTFKANALHDGILLYNAQTQDGKGHFLALVLRNGSVEFRYASGDGAAIIRSKEKVELNKLTNVVAERNERDGSLSINGGVAVKGASSGKSRGINLRQPMFLGGVDFQTRVAPGIGVNKGFTGCITEVILQGRKVNLVNNAISSNNIVNCESGGQLPCRRKPCLNYGLCVPIGTTDYRCRCYPQFSGKNCEIPVDVCKTNNPCRNNGECTMEGRNVQCRCRLGYTGRVCQTATRPVRTAVRLQGDGYVELMGELLPHGSSPVREVVSMTVQTTARDALLFWHGQEPATLGRGRDYVAIAIVNGHGFFNFDLGSGPANITTMERINDGRPHKIMVTRTGRDGNIEIDGFSIINGRSGGILQVLNTKGNIYLGGVPDFDRMTGGMYKRGLVGCLSDVEIQNKGPLDLGREALGGRNVQPCT